MKLSTIDELKNVILDIRKNLLKLCFKESIYIGDNLSISDVMIMLWQYQVNYDYTADVERFSIHLCNLVNPYVEVTIRSLGIGFLVVCGIVAGMGEWSSLKLDNFYTFCPYYIMLQLKGWWHDGR